MEQQKDLEKRFDEQVCCTEIFDDQGNEITMEIKQFMFQELSHQATEIFGELEKELIESNQPMPLVVRQALQEIKSKYLVNNN